MTLHTIKELCLSILKKEFSGKAISEEEYNYFIVHSNNKMFEFYLRQLIESSSIDSPLADKVEKSTELRPFKSYNLLSTLPIVLPSDFKLQLSLRLKIGGLFRNAEFLSEKEFSEMKTNVIVPNLSHYPKANIYQDRIQTIPTNITQYELWYLRTPEDPYYDYCLDSDTQIVYMPVGSKIVANGSNWDLKDSSNNLIAANVTHLLYPDQAHNSLTSELEWNETLHSKFVYFLLTEMGLSIKEDLIAQYSLSEQNK